MPSRSPRFSSATACCPSRSSRAGTAAGFTLLEVMVALAILGIGLGVIFQGLGQGLRLRGQTAEKVCLALAAESVLGALPERTEAPQTPEEGEEGGCSWRLEAVGRVVALGAVVGTDGSRGSSAAELIETRLTVTAPSGLSWEMFTLLPRADEAAR